MTNVRQHAITWTNVDLAHLGIIVWLGENDWKV